MIMMSEQEARSTIELYENTFGKELRRRTFRTWNDWAKAEQEFTPKDGSLQYCDTNGDPVCNDQKKSISKMHKIEQTPLNLDEINCFNMSNIKRESHEDSQQIIKTLLFNKSSTLMKTDEIKQLPKPSTIVSRLLSISSPVHHDNNDCHDEKPLDLSIKPSLNIKNKNYPIITPKDETIEQDNDDDHHHTDETFDETSSVIYLCSVCPYKHSDWSLVQHHISLHLNGQGVTCCLCSYTTSSRNSMFRHLTNIHRTSQITTNFQPSIPILTAQVLEQHQCSLCSYQCDCSEALNLHRRLAHDDEEFDIDSSDEEDDLTASTTKNLFDCPLCSPSSSTNNYTNLEQLTMHVITNHNNQSCPFCSFTAHITSLQTLTEHVKLHFNGTLVQPDPIIGIEQVKELLMLE